MKLRPDTFQRFFLTATALAMFTGGLAGAGSYIHPVGAPIVIVIFAAIFAVWRD